MSEIVPLFSKPIYKSVLNLEVIEYALEEAKKINYNYSIASPQDYLIDKLAAFKGEIVNKVNDYLYNHLKINNSFSYYFPDSWFVKISPQNLGDKHTHSNSLFSGIVYLKTVSDGGIIKFFRNHYSSHFNVEYELPYDELNLYNSEVFLIDPHPGLILLFPSNILHGVTENSSKEDRYSFAFNILPDNYRCHEAGQKVIER